MFPVHTATSSRSAWSSRRNSGNARAGTASRTASRGHGTRPPGTFAVVNISGNNYSRIGSRIGVLEPQSDSKGGLGLPQHSSPFLIDRPSPPVSRRLWPPSCADPENDRLSQTRNEPAWGAPGRLNRGPVRAVRCDCNMPVSRHPTLTRIAVTACARGDLDEAGRLTENAAGGAWGPTLAPPK